MRLKLPLVIAVFALVGSTGCNLFKTGASEGVSGRGAKAFDPYQSTASGAIRLSLQMFNGCALEPQGRFAGTSLDIPYPYGKSYGTYNDCRWQGDQSKSGNFTDDAKTDPTEPLHVLAGTTYFLNQLTIVNALNDVHTDPTNLNAVPTWAKTLAPFNKLDWSNLTITEDEWEPSTEGVSPYSFAHRVRWGNANWQKQKDDTFTVDVLDANGRKLTSATYSRADFLASNPATDHTMLRWEVNAVQPPAYPGEQEARAVSTPAPPGFPPTPPEPEFSSIFKIELETSTNPSNQFTIPDVGGTEGSIRVTWSQLPDDPFYFPVKFDDPQSLPSNCYSGSDPSKKVQCGFGDDPKVTFSPPADGGTFYKPGEQVTVTLAVKDSNGNFLNDPDHFPTYNDYLSGNANGLLYFNLINLGPAFGDFNTITGFTVVGPKQAMRPAYDMNDKSFWRLPTQQMTPGVGNNGLVFLGGPLAAQNVIAGMRDAPPPTSWNFTLPPDAKPGTYVLFWKVNRYFEGERFTKTIPIDFQVGQEAVTHFPGRVGNCQICHRGPISLDNIRMGLSVDYVEGCKVCHNRDVFPSGRHDSFARMIHKIHVTSDKFPMPKNQCSTCHLTRESALRPSYLVCSSCHASPHGDRFRALETTTDLDPTITDTVYGDCGSTCHAATPPTQHILPAQ